MAAYSKIIISLTTIPSRTEHLAPVLSALADQDVFDRESPSCEIWLTVPVRSVKENADYPLERLADMVKTNCKGRGRLHIAPEDYGPATKFLGALHSMPYDEQSLLITVDDDQLYCRSMASTLLRGAEKYAGCAVCLCGHVLGQAPFLWGFGCSRKPLAKALYLEAGTRVNVVSGWCGCAYPRHVFGKDGVSESMELLRKETPLLHRNDDLYVSCWLHLLGVPKVLVAYEKNDGCVDSEMAHAGLNALSSDDGSRSLRTMLKHANEWWRFSRSLQSAGLLERDLSVPWNKSLVFLSCAAAAAVVVSVAVGLFLFRKSL